MALCERCLAESPLDWPADAREVARLFASERPSKSEGIPLRHRTGFAVAGLVTAVVLFDCGRCAEISSARDVRTR